MAYDLTLTDAQIKARSQKPRSGPAPVAVVVPPRNPGTRKPKPKPTPTQVKRRRRRGRLAAYDRYLRSPEWKDLRRRVLTRDKHRCQECPSRRKLHVHHLTYERFGREQLSDLVTLCERCHRRVHRK